MEKTELLGVGITTASEKEILEYITKRLENGDQKTEIFTPNPEILMLAQKDPEFKKVLNSAQIALPDGVGLKIGGQILRKPIKARITGVDLMEKLCKMASGSAKQPVVTGFLGGEGGVAERTANCLQKKYPGLRVGFASDEWDPRLMTAPKIDILFVAFGAPNQEKWISENLPKIPVTVAMGVGGSFDFVAGKVMRAPALVRKIGLEWLFRLVVQPWRWKRQLQLLHFSRLIFAEALSSRLKKQKK